MHPKEKIKLANQSTVFECFGDNEKLAVSEIVARVNANQVDENGRAKLALGERTVRRALMDLEAKGFIRVYGRANNAVLYGKLSAAFADTDQNEKLIPYAGTLKSVGEYLELFADPEATPLVRKVNLLSRKAEHDIRKRMTYAVLMAGEPGVADQISRTQGDLTLLLNEVEFLYKVLQGFVNSPIWFEQYRDRMAYAIRDMQKKNPELFKLAVDYIQS